VNEKSHGNPIPLPLALNEEPRYLRAVVRAVLDGEMELATTELEAAVRGTVQVNAAVPPNPVVGMLATQLGATVIAETPTQAGPPAFVSPSAGARQCPHGTMTRIHGLTGKFGPYKGHFCPAKQGDPTKCTTVYIKATSPEFATFVADQTKA
jgi:hypothetical protein